MNFSFLDQLPDELLTTMIAMKAKSHLLYAHSVHVGFVSQGISELLMNNGYGSELPGDDSMLYAGFLHDVGMMSVHDSIFLKDTTLTTKEWEKITYHAEWGYNHLINIKRLKHLAPCILQHHEPDYPEKLPLDKILISSRVLIIAERFSAMVMDMPYRKAIPVGRTVSMLQGKITDFFGSHANEIQQYLLSISGNSLRHFEEFFSDNVFMSKA